MTSPPAFHLRCQEIGGQIHLQWYMPPLPLQRLNASLEIGLLTPKVVICSACRTISKQLVGSSPAWPSPMGLTTQGRPPWLFLLCDQIAMDRLKVIGALPRSAILPVSSAAS